MLEKLQCICNELKNVDEIAIMKEYGKDSKRFTLIISCKICTDIFCTIECKLNFAKRDKQQCNQTAQNLHCNFVRCSL